MKPKYFLLLLVLFSLSLPPAFSQSRMNYFKTDTASSIGIDLRRGTPKENTNFIRVKFRDSTVTYSPDEISEYGFKDGTIYVSKKIPLPDVNEAVFLEQLAKGKISLFFYKGRRQKAYFVQKDSGDIVKLDKDAQAFIQMSEDCEYIGDAIKLVSFNKKSLAKLVSNYNDCEPRPFSYSKFGVTAGLGMTNLMIPASFGSASIKSFTFEPTPSWLLGIYADLPIDMSNLSVNVGVNYMKNGFSEENRIGQLGTDILIDISMLEVPLLIRYTLPSLRWRPFLNAGPTYTYIIDNSSAVYRSEIGSNSIIIDEVITAPLFSEAMMGYSVGIGLQYNLDVKRTVSTELRYNQLFGFRNTLGKQQLNLSLGFSL